MAGRPRRTTNSCYVGHELTPENTYVRPSGVKSCRQCERDHWRRHYFKKHYGLKQAPPRGTRLLQSMKDKDNAPRS